MAAATWYGEPAFGFTRRLEGWTFGDAVAATREALAGEGFGVLTEIDVKATLKKKLDADFRNYLILGACNPPLAHRALQGVPGIGLLLPCNVVVTEEDDGAVVVSTIDPKAMFQVVDHPGVASVADEVGAKLQRVLAAIG